MKYTKIDRELLLGIINKHGGTAAFGASINRSKSFVEDIIRSGYVQEKTVSAIRNIYGIDITLLDKQKILETKIQEAAKIPVQHAEPSTQILPKQEHGDSKSYSEIINRLDKAERNINDIAVTLRLMLDIMQAQEKRSRNKPYAR